LASTGTLTLTGSGSDIFIFRAASSLVANTLSNVVLVGVDPCNVFWQVTTLATLNGDTFAGTVVAQTGVHLGAGTTTVPVSLTGRALAAAGGDVTLAGFDTVGGCSAAGTPAGPTPTATVTGTPPTATPTVTGTPPTATPTETPIVINTEATPPTLSKLFSPSFLIGKHRDPILVITLCNPNSSPAYLIAPLTDTLPDGVVIAATPNASTTCPGSGPVATAGGTTVTLPLPRSIPASDCCTVSVNVIATRSGDFVNTLPPDALQTSNGNNTVLADATLTVKLLPVPMLSGWGMIMLTALLALVAFVAMRRQAM
jgi:hypothetical protein